MCMESPGKSLQDFLVYNTEYSQPNKSNSVKLSGSGQGHMSSYSLTVDCLHLSICDFCFICHSNSPISMSLLVM